jgi:trehalose 6-phosphate phosphatase
MPDSNAARLTRQRSVPPPLGRDCALFLDVDGTLAEHAAKADDVQIDAELIRSLPRVAAYLGGALAVITGRSIASVDRLFPDVRMPIAGQHGSERRDAGGAIHLDVADPDMYARLRESLATFAARHPGLYLEDKGRTLALHYREVPRLAAYVHRKLRAIADSIGGGSFELQPGKRTLELRPESQDKGTAIAQFMAEPPFLGRKPVFAGDDNADEYGFAVVDDAGGWSIKVGRGRSNARYRLTNIADVRRWVMAPIVADAGLHESARCAT